jgi:hypothetical protein
MIYFLSSTPVTSLTALISESSRDTRSFATSIPNIVPKWINLSLTSKVLITDHSPRVVESANDNCGGKSGNKRR